MSKGEVLTVALIVALLGGVFGGMAWGAHQTRLSEERKAFDCLARGMQWVEGSCVR